ncbi:MAG: hypothetical protein ACM3QS_14900 [Bacteroidota bacterium]
MHQKFVLITFAVALGTAALYLLFARPPRSTAGAQAIAWLRDAGSRPEPVMKEGGRCGNAPFIFPTDGVVGYLWDDSFQPGHRHQGIDIFSGTGVGVTRVVAAYPGYVTRKNYWKAALITRIPQDPLHPGRQIWVYYTHMADRYGNSLISTDFPPGTSEKYVEAGTLLGYQGNYSGDPNKPVGVHLHLSVVQGTGAGGFKNELDINNTYDPSPYFGLPLNARTGPDEIPPCNGL